MKRAVFLDRDGVINRVAIEDGKPLSPRRFEEFDFLPGIEQFVKELKEAGYLRVVVTNQPDLARGRLEKDDLDKMHDLIGRRLQVDGIYACLHDDGDNCGCRKPKPGLLHRAAREWDIDLSRSFMLGDTWRDVEAGKGAGCRTILLQTPYNTGAQGDHRVKSFAEALEIILGPDPPEK